MLKRFTVENYKNFKNPIVIDFTDVRDYKYNEYCVKNGLLSKAVIYGKNGSGKSNFGFALYDLVLTLTDNNTQRRQIDEVGFLNADSTADYANFKYEFDFDGRDVIYEYRKSQPEVLVEEHLVIDGQAIYDYDFSNGNAHMLENNLALIGADLLDFNNMPSNFAVLRYIANNTKLSEDSIPKKLVSFANNMLWFRSLETNNYIGLKVGGDKIMDYIIENNYVKDFQEFLFEYGGLQYKFKVVKNAVDGNKHMMEVHKNKSLDFLKMASNGTMALALYFYWSKSFNKVSLLFIDEFDAFYHFELAEKILSHISRANDVQAIFTSHNTDLISNDILRPDCYFIMSDGKMTSLINATDRELRQGHNLSKMFKNGEFNG